MSEREATHAGTWYKSDSKSSYFFIIATKQRIFDLCSNFDRFWFFLTMSKSTILLIRKTLYWIFFEEELFGSVFMGIACWFYPS